MDHGRDSLALDVLGMCGGVAKHRCVFLRFLCTDAGRLFFLAPMAGIEAGADSGFGGIPGLGPVAFGGGAGRADRATAADPALLAADSLGDGSSGGFGHPIRRLSYRRSVGRARAALSGLFSVDRDSLARAGGDWNDGAPAGVGGGGD